MKTQNKNEWLPVNSKGYRSFWISIVFKRVMQSDLVLFKNKKKSWSLTLQINASTTKSYLVAWLSKSNGLINSQRIESSKDFVILIGLAAAVFGLAVRLLNFACMALCCGLCCNENSFDSFLKKFLMLIHITFFLLNANSY